MFKQPEAEEERAEVAEACMLGLHLDLPMVLDEMTNEVDTAYAALPDRLYLVDNQGRIRYRSEPGPWGFKVDEWEKAIEEETARK